MAIISSHALNGVDGTHARGIPVLLKNLLTGKDIFNIKMDNNGRLKKEIKSDQININDYCELIFFTEKYWKNKNLFINENQILDQVVIRFKILSIETTYHIPIILSPNTYSVWWAGEHK